MVLKTYIKTLTKEELDDFAKRCGTTAGQVIQVAGGYRRAGESLAINIERETAGQIRCEDLRPDVDWAVLRQSA